MPPSLAVFLRTERTSRAAVVWIFSLAALPGSAASVNARTNACSSPRYNVFEPRNRAFLARGLIAKAHRYTPEK